MINKIKNIIILSLFFSVMTISYSFASKYTIASGKDFNARIKMYFDKNNTSATADYYITAFKYSSSLDGTPIDISEDGDSSVLAYIKNNIIQKGIEEGYKTFMMQHMYPFTLLFFDIDFLVFQYLHVCTVFS